MLVIVESLTFN